MKPRNALKNRKITIPHKSEKTGDESKKTKKKPKNTLIKTSTQEARIDTDSEVNTPRANTRKTKKNQNPKTPRTPKIQHETEIDDKIKQKRTKPSVTKNTKDSVTFKKGHKRQKIGKGDPETVTSERENSGSEVCNLIQTPLGDKKYNKKKDLNNRNSGTDDIESVETQTVD